MITLTLVSTNRVMVARMSWWPETSSSVSGLYFSTLESSTRVPIDARVDRVYSPWQAILSFNGQVRSASFAFRAGVVGAEGESILYRWHVHVHLVIFEVGHVENWNGGSRGWQVMTRAVCSSGVPSPT